MECPTSSKSTDLGLGSKRGLSDVTPTCEQIPARHLKIAFSTYLNTGTAIDEDALTSPGTPATRDRQRPWS